MVGVGRRAGRGKDGEWWTAVRWEGWAEEITTKEGECGGQDEGVGTGLTERRLGGGEGTGTDGEGGSEGWRDGGQTGEGRNGGDTWKGGGTEMEGEAREDEEAERRGFLRAEELDFIFLGFIWASHIAQTERKEADNTDNVSQNDPIGQPEVMLIQSVHSQT